MAKIKVLLVDDLRNMYFDQGDLFMENFTFGEDYSKFIKESTHEIIIIRSPLAAIEYLQAFSVGILILDHDMGFFDENMREVTGMAVLDFLEQNPKLIPHEINIVTANASKRKQMIDLSGKIMEKKNELSEI